MDTAVNAPNNDLMDADVGQPSNATRSCSAENDWPVLKVVVTRPWIPATNAERTQHYRLFHAFLIHAVLVLIGFVLVMSLIPMLDAPSGTSWIERIGRASLLWGELAREVERKPMPNAVTVVASPFVFEAACVAVALLIAPWGARDEPMLASYANGVRQTWLHTPHLVMVVFLCVVVGGGLDLSTRRWWNEQPHWSYEHLRPERPANDVPAGSPAWQQYNRLDRMHRSVWSAQWQHLRAKQPWWVAHDEVISIVCYVGAAVWVLVGLLRAVAARRIVGVMARPPTCDACGYNLTGTAADGRCSECGRPVVDSLGPNVRLGSAWDRRRMVGWHRAFLRTSYRAVTHPVKLAKQLSVTAPDTFHRSFVLRQGFFMLVLGYLGISASFLADRGWRIGRSGLDNYIFLAPCLSALALAAVFGFSLAVVNVVGVYFRVRCGRNLLGAAMQVSAYLSAVHMLWVIFAGASGVAIIIMDNKGWFREYTTNEMAGSFVWCALNLIWLVAYVGAVARGTAATRFANR